MVSLEVFLNRVKGVLQHVGVFLFSGCQPQVDQVSRSVVTN